MLESLKQRANILQGRLDYINESIKKKEDLLLNLNNRLTYIEQAQVLLQTTAKETQDNLKIHLEDIVQMALDACFPDEYSFCVDFIPKGTKTSCEMYIIDDTGFKLNPMNSNGGGLVDIISLALRIAVWSLSKPDNLIVLDEPFKFLSANLRPLAGELLQNLSEKLGLQIIMVTHDPILIDISNKVFSVVKNKNGVSVVN